MMENSTSAVHRAIEFANQAQHRRDSQADLVAELQEFPSQFADAKRLLDEMELTFSLAKIYKDYLISFIED